MRIEANWGESEANSQSIFVCVKDRRTKERLIMDDNDEEERFFDEAERESFLRVLSSFKFYK
jgi:hypothetical protein